MADTEKTTATTSTDEKPSGERAFDKRWGEDIVSGGYLLVPSILLRAQARLHLDCVELAVLLHLIDHWWSEGKMPFPSKQRLSERIGKSEKTIQRAMARLESEGLVKRISRHNPTGGQTSNTYDLKPLIAKLRPIAKEMKEAREEAKATIRSPEKPGHRLRKKVKVRA